MQGVRFKRKKDTEKAKGGRPSSALSAAAPVLGKKIASKAPEAAAAQGPVKKAEEQAAQNAEPVETKVAASTGSPRKRQKVEGPTPAANQVEPHVQGKVAAAEEAPSQKEGKPKTRKSLGAAVAKAVAAVAVKDIPKYPGSAPPEVPFHEGLTAVLEDKRLVQLLRHICAHEQRTIDATFKDHQDIATAAETVLKGWVRTVKERLQRDPEMVVPTQALVGGDSSPGAAEAEEDDALDERREALLALRSNLLSEEQGWQRLIAAQDAVLVRDAEARAQERPSEMPLVESAGVDEALEETRRKLAFQAEALCQMVSGVSDLCRRAEQANKDLAQDFGAKLTSILPQGSPRTLINRFMSYTPASDPS